MSKQGTKREEENTNPPATAGGTDTDAATQLYNAEAEQFIPVMATHKGRRYQVMHRLGPQTDESLIEYDRKRDVRLGQMDAGEGGGESGLFSKNSSFAASLWLWNDRKIDVQGWGPTDGSKVSERNRAAVIDEAYLACAIAPLPIADADEDKPWEDDEDDTNTIRLRCLFSGIELITEHVLREPTADDMARFKGIMSRALIVQGTKLGKQETRIPSRLKDLSVLYNSLKIQTSGYAGRIPLHHQMEVVMAHMGTNQEVVTGN